MKKYIFGILFSLLVISFTAIANESNGKINKLLVNQNGLVLFKLDKLVNHRPKCATNADWDYQFSLDSNGGEAMYQLLKLSVETSKDIIVGYGPDSKCSNGFPAIEVRYVYFNYLNRKDYSGKGNHL